MGHARHVRERPRSGNPARLEIWPQAAFLGSAQAQASAGDRFRRGASARLRAPPGARSDQGLRLRQLRHQPEGPLLVDLDLVPRRRQMGGEEDHRRFPAEPADPDDLPPVLQGVQGGAAARHRHRPVDGRPLPLRLVLGHRRHAAIRRVRSVQSEAHGKGPDRRHRLARDAIRRRRTAGSTAGRKWSRSAATESASTSPTRSTAPSTRSSIQTGSTAGW